MAGRENRLPLAGSERAIMQGAKEIGPANPNEQVEVTIRLHSRGKRTDYQSKYLHQTNHRTQALEP